MERSFYVLLYVLKAICFYLPLPKLFVSLDPHGLWTRTIKREQVCKQKPILKDYANAMSIYKGDV